ncbi:MAG: PEGA domain-containing protein [Spirochaetaceae bacterium]
MKKIFFVIILNLILSYSFSFEDKFNISEESIEILELNQVEYEQSIYYSSDDVFESGFNLFCATSNVNIYIDGKEYSSNDLELNLTSGTYLLQIKRNKYVTFKKWISIVENSRLIINVELARKFGYIDVSTNSNKYKTFMSGILINKEDPIPTGSYNIKVQGFGFKDENRIITINSNLITKENFILEPAAFILEDLKIEKEIFNKKANDGFSRNSIKILVNGPQDSSISISDKSGSIILTKHLVLDNWDTLYYFSQFLSEDIPNGIYTISINAGDQIKTEQFIIDSSLILKNLPINRGFSGLLASPTAEVNGYDANQVNFNFKSQIENSILSIPFSLQTSITSYLQLNSGLDFNIDFNGETTSISLFAGVFLSNNLNNILYGLNLNYQFTNIQTDESSDIENCIIINSPITLDLTPLYLSISPEYKILLESDNTVGSGIGFHFDNQKYRFGISGRADTTDFKNYTLLYGIEAFYLLKNTQSFAGIAISSNELFDIILTISLSTIF